MKVLFLEAEKLYDDLLPAGLRQIGCEVKMVNEVLRGNLARALVGFRPDFVLMMGWSYFPTAERLAVIRETLDFLNIPLVLWSTEDPCWHEEWCVPFVDALAPDLVLTICAEYVSRYREMGYEAACLPFGYNHELYRPVAPWPDYACDIAVVASFYTAQFHDLNRKRSIHDLLIPLLDKGYDLRIWGKDWHKAHRYGVRVPRGVWQGPLDHREAPAVYSSAKIVIGLQNEFDFDTNLTMRTCEIMGTGAFMLTSRTRAVEKLFVHKEHLAMSGSPEETLELVDYYLQHPEERTEIAAAGQELVRSCHTYEHRARVVEELFLMLKEFRTRRGCRPICICLPPGPYFCPCDDSSSSSCSDSGSGSDSSDSSSSSSSGCSCGESGSESESECESGSESESDTGGSEDCT